MFSKQLPDGSLNSLLSCIVTDPVLQGWPKTWWMLLMYGMSRLDNRAAAHCLRCSKGSSSVNALHSDRFFISSSHRSIRATIKFCSAQLSAGSRIITSEPWVLHQRCGWGAGAPRGTGCPGAHSIPAKRGFLPFICSISTSTALRAALPISTGRAE